MSTHTRFSCPSASLRLKSLLKRTRNILWIGLGLAIAVHLSLTQIGGFAEEQKAAKPLTTQFIKRQPRLTKPLELKKRLRPKRRTMQRRMVSVKARVSRQDLRSRARPSEVLGSLAQPQTPISSGVSWTGIDIEPEALAEAIEGTRESQHRMDMSLELMDVDAMDMGRYHAMVIQDPNDKRAIRGFIHIAMLAPLNSETYRIQVYGKWRTGIQELSDFMNEHTGIRSDANKMVSFDSMELFYTPWVYLCRMYDFDPTHSELENLGRYMMSGGFFWGDSFGQCRPYIPGYNSMNYLIINSMETQGFIYKKDWNYERLPNTHTLLHCYFDFDTPPMAWGARAKHWGLEVGWDTTPYLDAIIMDGVVIVLKTEQAYILAWAQFGKAEMDYLDPTRCFHFGVNTIIYALTREGLITHRVMDAVK